MEEWKEYKLGDLCTELSDGLHKAPKFVNGGDYIFVNAKNISNGFVVDNDPTKKSDYEEYLKYSSPLNETTVLYSIDGTIGNIALYRGEKCILGKGACYMNPNPALLDRMYLYYELQAPHFKLYIDKMSTGSTIKHISLKTMRNYEMKVPSIKTQQQLVSILKSLDDKIEVNRRINENLEQQAQALFKSWFVDFEPFKDQPFVESELGMIPQSWRVVAFKDFITPTTEKVPVGSLPEYSVTNNGIIPRDAKFNKKLSKETSKNKVLRKDNLVFGMSREILNWGIMEDEIGGVSSAYNVYKIDKGIIDPVYLKLYMTARISDFNSLIGTAAREGQSLDKGALMQKTVYVPSTKIIGEFFRLYLSIVALKKEAEEESRRLAELRDTLLPRLMSGELKVNDVQMAISE